MQEKKKKAHVIFYADSPQQVGGFLKSDWKSGKLEVPTVTETASRSSYIII
jgi:hypothetical protein